MKKLVKIYSYELETSIIKKENSYEVISSIKDYIKAEHPKRSYKTKMMPSDLPERYCDVKRYGSCRECIDSQDIVDMNYSWIPENHFMKDSVLRISYSGKLEPYNYEYDYNGEHFVSPFIEYKNIDANVFGNDIFKFLGYAKKYSNFDISDIRNEFIKQCNWLKENEPIFAPKTDDFGKWFDEHIEINKENK